MLLVIALFVAEAPPARANDPLRLVLTASRVTESLAPAGSSDELVPGGLATFSLIVENDAPQPRPFEASIGLPPGVTYLPETLRINGLPTPVRASAQGSYLRWPGLAVPAAQPGATSNLAGLHIFLTRYPSYEEIDERLAWAARMVGPGGSLKFFLPSITEHYSGPPDWAVYLVRRIYELGLHPVVRLGYANGDGSSFTRRAEFPVGQMNRADAAGGYWRIGWATRNVVAGLLAGSAAAAAAAPSAELAVILGNEPNLEWVERDWFIDYGYVRRADGSFDGNWLTTDPADPTAAANSASGWRRFVRGLPRGSRPATYDTRLDDYKLYLGYDAAVEYGRFLRTTSGLLRELNSPRVAIAAGAVAAGGGDLEGRYAYHSRHFYRRMLQALPDALEHVDLLTANNYPYTIPPWDNYHRHPADFERYPLGEPFWHTEVSIDAYRSDLDYLAYLKRRGIAKFVPQRALIGEVNYGIAGTWSREFSGPPVTEDLRASYMATIFEEYYNRWRGELAGVNLWQLTDPDLEQGTYRAFDFVYPDSRSAAGWPTHRHLVYDVVATRGSRPGPGRSIITFQARVDPQIAPGPAVALARLEPDGLSASYALVVPAAAAPSANSTAMASRFITRAMLITAKKKL